MVYCPFNEIITAFIENFICPHEILCNNKNNEKEKKYNNNGGYTLEIPCNVLEN